MLQFNLVIVIIIVAWYIIAKLILHILFYVMFKLSIQRSEIRIVLMEQKFLLFVHRG